jgi:hypothetical protein
MSKLSIATKAYLDISNELHSTAKEAKESSISIIIQQTITTLQLPNIFERDNRHNCKIIVKNAKEIHNILTEYLKSIEDDTIL